MQGREDDVRTAQLHFATMRLKPRRRGYNGTQSAFADTTGLTASIPSP